MCLKSETNTRALTNSANASCISTGRTPTRCIARRSIVSCSRRAFLAAVLLSAGAVAQVEDSKRLNQHRVTNRSSPAPEPGAELEQIPSLIDGLRSAEDWRKIRRPELLRLWT